VSVKSSRKGQGWVNFKLDVRLDIKLDIQTEEYNLVRAWVRSDYNGHSGSAGVYIPFIYIYLGRTLPYPVHGTTSYKVVWFYWVNISSIK
jgi:hypothetical protein